MLKIDAVASSAVVAVQRAVIDPEAWSVPFQFWCAEAA